MVFICDSYSRSWRPWVVVLVLISLVLVVPAFSDDDNSLATNESSDTDPLMLEVMEETPQPEITPGPEITEVPDPPLSEQNSGEFVNETTGQDPNFGNPPADEPSVPESLSENIIEPQSQGGSNGTELMEAMGNITDVPQETLPANESASTNQSISGPLTYYNVTPPWAEDLVDPPLNGTNLVPGIISGTMWEINGTTGSGYYPLEMSLDTTSRIGIWIHDVSDVVLDGMGHYLRGDEGLIGIEGSIGILVNGAVSNIQIKNFNDISDWADGIVVDSGKNITIGDTLVITDNANSGVNVSNTEGLDINGTVFVNYNSNGGIVIRDSSEIKISNDVDLYHNYDVIDLFAYGDGLHIVNSSDITISGPVNARNNAVGIVIGNCSDIAILGRVASFGNNYTGLSISSSDNIRLGEDPSGHPVMDTNGDSGIHLSNVTDARINDTSVVDSGIFGIFSEYSGQILLYNITQQNAGSSEWDAGLRILGSQGWHNIVNSSFTHNSGDGIEVIDSNHTWVENTVLIDNDRNGIGLGKSDMTMGSNFCSVNNSTIHDNDGNGIASYWDEGLVVFNNNIYDNQGDGIFQYHDFHAEIRDNRIHDNDGAGINATANSWGDNIVNNEIRDNRDGILLDTSGKSSITDNFIYNGGAYVQNRGIVLFNGPGNTVSNNEIQGQHEGALFVNLSDDNKVIHNQIDTNPLGIRVERSNNTIIDANNLTDNYQLDTPVISCIQSTFTSITGNSVTGSSIGLFLDISNDTLISGNSFSDVSHPIQLDSTERTLIEGNTIDTNQRGIDGQDVNDTTIVGNTIHSYNTGISLTGSRNTLVYNNDFRNVDSIELTGSNDVSWNVIPVPGPNIMGGPSIGGNYWSTPANTGWSQTNPDTDGDGFTDSPYTFLSGQIDQHPLSLAGEYHPPEPKPPAPEGGGGSVPVILTPPAGLTWGGSMASETFPDQVCAGSSVPVSVTVEAGGNSGWFPGAYGLGTYNDAAGSAGSAFIPVSGVDMVNPGSQYTFSFTITAPSTPGTYTFQYCMRKSDGTWFGDVISITLNVVNCGGSKGVVKEFKPGSTPVYPFSPLPTANPRPTITPWKKLPE